MNDPCIITDITLPITIITAKIITIIFAIISTATGFLATSSKREVAAKFAFEADKAHPCAVWRIQFDKRGKRHPEFRVQHMTFVVKTLVIGEEEYLFAPYSVFTLVSVRWSAKLGKPHEFLIQPACDNKQEDEGLPLTPWY